MIRIKADPNNRKVILKISAAPQEAREGVRRGLYLAGKSLVEDSKKRIKEGPKTGRVYRIRKGGRVYLHQSSAPGEAPASFTGKLRRSIGFVVNGFSGMEFGAKQNYGEFLELGTRKMKKRPFLEKSVNALQSFVLRTLTTEIGRRLK